MKRGEKIPRIPHSPQPAKTGVFAFLLSFINRYRRFVDKHNYKIMGIVGFCLLAPMLHIQYAHMHGVPMEVLFPYRNKKPEDLEFLSSETSEKINSKIEKWGLLKRQPKKREGVKTKKAKKTDTDSTSSTSQSTQ